MSALAVHSLRRVVRRNEHQSLLSDPRFIDSTGARRVVHEISHFDKYRTTRPRDVRLASVETAFGDMVDGHETPAAARGSWQWVPSPRVSAASSDSGIIDLSRAMVDLDSPGPQARNSNQVV